ncbi:hypothetical protein JRG18_11440 [Kocuria palustris]|uniref:hypothetical protein n=1 Tax=Kocuria palustris TaxID=71999 RepID=UPI00045EBB4A|nr:hypothetical protein [Kocuria palustris]MBN6753500.1 hypothetical protein [Kocuria palustris]MBN6759075.1 hypothetical protein [Kocuria palustris]MBN6763588.1 hypothetical protein [Kocuria palustris]MBN6783005.1 hypothetical protein [Kocuria palustris]MBN6799523.1 hypothetical protein [Kocuria palustris]
MRIRAHPWTWRNRSGTTRGALIAAQITTKERRTVFVPAEKLYALADELVDIAESIEKENP